MRMQGIRRRPQHQVIQENGHPLAGAVRACPGSRPSAGMALKAQNLGNSEEEHG